METVKKKKKKKIQMEMLEKKSTVRDEEFL